MRGIAAGGRKGAGQGASGVLVAIQLAVVIAVGINKVKKRERDSREETVEGEGV